MSGDELRDFVTSADGAIHYTQHLSIEIIGDNMHLQDRKQDNAWIAGVSQPLEEWR